MASPMNNKPTASIWRSVDAGGPQQIFALVDAARDKGIYDRLAAADNKILPLFSGSKASELALVGPYLAHLENGDALAQWLAEKGWGKSWGVYCLSSESIDKLKRHFYSMLKVFDEEGNCMFFRYYDPRVLRVYLPTCNAAELQLFFGPVDRFYAEAEEEGVTMEYSVANGKLVQNRI